MGCLSLHALLLVPRPSHTGIRPASQQPTVMISQPVRDGDADCPGARSPLGQAVRQLGGSGLTELAELAHAQDSSFLDRHLRFPSPASISPEPITARQVGGSPCISLERSVQAHITCPDSSTRQFYATTTLSSGHSHCSPHSALQTFSSIIQNIPHHGRRGRGLLTPLGPQPC
jgi:hypothetical protein